MNIIFGQTAVDPPKKFWFRTRMTKSTVYLKDFSAHFGKDVGVC